jgi:hypothetical protein
VQGTMPVSSAAIVYKNFSVVYGSDASLPNVVSGVLGGSASNPEELPANNVDEITVSIGTDVPESFFRFHWNGGAFESVANLTGADPSSTYEFELLGGPGGSAILDSADSFQGNISFANLAAGNYAIGISTTAGTDPTYYIDFAAPISGVPESSTWAMMLVGFVGLGFAGSRASRRSETTKQPARFAIKAVGGHS